MVAANTQSLVSATSLRNPRCGTDASESPRSGSVQPIGDLMSQVLARYLPAEDLWQERSRIALKTVSAAAG